jgi:hypothetical protein
VVRLTCPWRLGRFGCNLHAASGGRIKAKKYSEEQIIRALQKARLRNVSPTP